MWPHSQNPRRTFGPLQLLALAQRRKRSIEECREWGVHRLESYIRPALEGRRGGEMQSTALDDRGEGKPKTIRSFVVREIESSFPECQGRSETRPLWRRKIRPHECVGDGDWQGGWRLERRPAVRFADRV